MWQPHLYQRAPEILIAGFESWNDQHGETRPPFLALTVSDSGSSIIDAVAQGLQQLPALRCFINRLTSDLTPLTWDSFSREFISKSSH